MRRETGRKYLYFGIVVTLLVLNNTGNAAPISTDSIHQTLLRGQSIEFKQDAEESQRSVNAAWIAEAVNKSIKIDIRNAVITGALELTQTNIVRPILMRNCTFKETPDFSDSTFRDRIVLSGCIFERGGTFHHAVFETDVEIRDAEFRNGRGNFLDVNFQGMFDGEGLIFFSEVRANFERARFARTAAFTNSVFGSGASFSNAHFAGEAQFRNASFAQKADFYHVQMDSDASFDSDINEDGKRIPAARFQGPANFDGGRFAGSVFFQGVVFGGRLSFNAADIARNAYFCDDADNAIPGPTFEGSVDFTNAHFGRSAYFAGTVFKQNAIFNSVRIDGYAAFWGLPEKSGETVYFHAPRFEGMADFSSAIIGAEAQFRGAIFRQKVTFYGAQIGANALFENDPYWQMTGTQFLGEADFAKVHISGEARFEGTTFAKEAKFDAADVAGTAYFRAEPDLGISGAVFGANAIFTIAHFRGQAEFQGAKFQGEAQFSGTIFDANAYFYSLRNPEIVTVFNGTASFVRAHFAGAVDFRDSTFQNEAKFYETQFDALAQYQGVTFAGQADFGLAHFGADAYFSNSVFAQDVLFDRSRCDSLLNFEGTTFRNKLTLQEGTVRVLHFSRDGRVAHGSQQTQAEEQFQGPVDLRGCTYDRVYEQVDQQTAWKTLVAHFQPYDRQPYTQLEKIFRAIGQDRVADKVYIAQQDKERELKWQQGDYVGWFWRFLYKLFLNYGIRPYQLVALSVIFIAIGTVLFSRPGAVEKKDQAPDEPELKITKREALGVSLRLFLPIDIIMGSRFVPTRKKFSFAPASLKPRWWLGIQASTYATFFLQIAGWILVPLSIAAITGLLKVS